MKSVWIFLLIISIPAFSQQKSIMDKEVQKFFKSKYEDPVIENQSGNMENVFPKLTFYSVFEKKNLVEDPLIPDVWIVTSNRKFFRNYDIEKALEEEKIIPQNETKALNFAKHLIMSKYNVYYHITDENSSSGVVPEKYFQEKFYPSVKKLKNGYIVTIHFYYPEERFSSFYSLYKNNLVEFVVTIEGCKYRAKEGRVYYDENDRDELNLNQAVIDHICNKNLFKNLEVYLQKRDIYGMTDPPERELIEQRIAELTDLWQKGFTEHHYQIYSLLKKVMDKNPEFMFDSENIYEKTKNCRSVKNIEYYQSTLDHTLQDIISRFAEYGNGKK